MSPEQIRAEPLDARTDLFSFGVVLYEMATGKLPFRGESQGMIFDSILNHAPVPAVRLNPDVPAELERIIDKCLEKDRDQRYKHASEIRTDLQRLKRDTDSVRVLPISKPAKRWRVVTPAAAAVLVFIAAGYFYFHRTPRLTDKDTIVLADFVNKTGDPLFDETLRQGLSVQLEQSPFLSLVSDQVIQKTLGLMGRPASVPLTPDLGREICERTASAAVLDGSIAGLGSQYVVGLRARNCRTGAVLDEEQAQAPRKEEVLNALDQIASKFRTKIGESLATVQKYDTPLAEATTPSLEALKAYSEGWKVSASKGPAASIPFFKRATELDPQFAMAYAMQGVSYGSMGETGLAEENLRKGHQLRDRASDAEKFFIDCSYELNVTGNMEIAQQSCEAWEQAYPREPKVHGLLGGSIYPVLGKYRLGAEESRKVIDLDPDISFGYNILAFAYIELDNLEEAEKVLQRASARKLEMPDLLIGQFEIAYLRGDKAGMDRAVALGQGKAATEDWLSDQEALALTNLGQLKLARRKSQRATDMAQQAAQLERAALWKTGEALWEAFFGNMAAARQAAMAALKFSKGREVEYGAAFALALAGDSSLPRELADDLAKQFPEDTAVQFSYLPALRALLALKHGDSGEAIELLQKASLYELGAPQSSFFGSFGALYPVYVRGEAYLAGKQGAEAAVEFQKILDNRGVVIIDTIGALARQRVAKALAMSGDVTKAKAAYENFLTIWKDADPDIPLLQQAKAEYAKLQ